MLGADLVIENKSVAGGTHQPCGTYADPPWSTSVIWQADVTLDQLLLLLSVLSDLFRHRNPHCHKTNEVYSLAKEKIHNDQDSDKVGKSCCLGRSKIWF